MKAILIAAIFAVGASGMGHPRGLGARSVEARRIEQFLCAYLPSDGTGQPVRYYAAMVSLHGPNSRDAIVYLVGGGYCGSGGCTTLILAEHGEHFRLVSRIMLTRPPIRVLTTRTMGWSDLAVFVAGGGNYRPYTARLQFNWQKYPGSAWSAGASPLRHAAPGETVISPEVYRLARPLAR